MRAALTAAALALLTLTACDSGGNALSGSLSGFHDLSFSEVRARLYTSELAIEYVRANREVALRVTYRRAETDPTGPATVDLAAHGDVTGHSAGISVPPLDRGDLTLRRYTPEEDATIRGHFDLVFEAGLTEVSLHGSFDTVVDVIE